MQMLYTTLPNKGGSAPTPQIMKTNPDNKVHGANIGPTWDLSAPDGPHVGPMNLAIREGFVDSSSIAMSNPITITVMIMYSHIHNMKGAILTLSQNVPKFMISFLLYEYIMQGHQTTIFGLSIYLELDYWCIPIHGRKILPFKELLYFEHELM